MISAQRAERARAGLAQGFRRLYAEDAPGLAERAGGRALAASEVVAKALGKRRRSAPGYSRDTQDFADVAKLIKADVGLETAWLDLGAGIRTAGRAAAKTASCRDSSIAWRAPWPRSRRSGAGLPARGRGRHERVGRTARENGTGGTDHGHGNVMLVLGGKVQGGACSATSRPYRRPAVRGP